MRSSLTPPKEQNPALRILNEIPPGCAKETQFFTEPPPTQLPVALWVINRRLGNTSASVSPRIKIMVTNEWLEWNIRTWTEIVIQNVVALPSFPPSYSNSGTHPHLPPTSPPQTINCCYLDGQRQQPYHSFSIENGVVTGWRCFGMFFSLYSVAVRLDPARLAGNWLGRVIWPFIQAHTSAMCRGFKVIDDFDNNSKQC